MLATFAYDERGRRTRLTRGNGTFTSYAYDPASLLSRLIHNPAGSAKDLTLEFTSNAADEIVTNTRSRGQKEG